MAMESPPVLCIDDRPQVLTLRKSDPESSWSLRQAHKAERHARGFTSWGQFMAMLFCQVGRAHSLREIYGGLACAGAFTTAFPA
jgi:hypothetical protein